MTSEGWRTVPVGELCLGIYDGPHATPKKTESGPIFLGISSLNNGRLDLSSAGHLSEQDFVKWTRRVTPQLDDIVFSYETRLGEAAMIPEGLKCCLGRRMALMRPDASKVVPRFLLFAYLAPEFQETLRRRTVHGSTVDRILLTEFESFPIRIPSLPAQWAIAEFLGALDDKIELNRRINETLEATARAIFKSWFVDFDPVRAKMDGRQPAGMDAETASLFPRSFEDSAVSRLPTGWRVDAIGDVVKVLGGSTPPTADPAYWSGEYYFVTPRDMSSLADPVLLHSERRITKAGLGRISSGLLPAGTVLLSSRAPIGYLATAEVPVAINQGIIAMVCGGAIPNHYARHWAAANLDVIIGNANGTTFLEISKRNFRPIPIIVPQSRVLNRFLELAEPLHRRLVSNVRESERLGAIRDALLPKLISGEIRVADEPIRVG